MIFKRRRRHQSVSPRPIIWGKWLEVWEPRDSAMLNSTKNIPALGGLLSCLCFLPHLLSAVQHSWPCLHAILLCNYRHHNFPINQLRVYQLRSCACFTFYRNICKKRGPYDTRTCNYNRKTNSPTAVATEELRLR